ncbi:MAG: DUF3052 domain-containing protein [Candidatus Freyarchaeum deiterrae]
MAAGYSIKSLIEKLGIRESYKIIILNPPKNYGDTLGELPKNVTVTNKLKGPLNFIHFFTKKREELETKFPILKHELSRTGVLWISWPKVSSKIETDLNENIVREIGLKNGLVDVKIIAIDGVWSGLKFVYRLKDRK